MDAGGAAANKVGLKRYEPRWPVALAVVAVFVLLEVLPERVRILPAWVLWALCAAVLAPLAFIAFRKSDVWQRVEAWVVVSFAVFAGLGNLAFLAILLRDIIGRFRPVSGLALLSSSAALWCVNVLMFSLLYWQMDRGGPSQRTDASDTLRDWGFPQDSAPQGEVRPGWRPTYPDYLFLSFSTATAFSTTEVAPFTTRAKMLMMAEAAISLMTLALVAARAINILGS
jgi:hypothetical protein